MRQAKILFKGEEAGTLTQHNDGNFTFQYNSSWIGNSAKPGISLTFPKSKAAFHSPHLFSFFYNMLPEGYNKQVVCALNRIDQDDHFGLLMTVAKNDTIGAVRVLKMESE